MTGWTVVAVGYALTVATWLAYAWWSSHGRSP